MSTAPLAIAYVGPIAQPGQPARGGFESANRRLIDDLRHSGITVTEYPYAPERSGKFAKLLSYGLNFLGLAWSALKDSGKWQILHITPLRDQFILPEELVCRLAKWRGAKVVVDLRAGNLSSNLNSSNGVERSSLERMLRLADLVSVEGLDYLPLVAPFTSNTLYLPNYVDAVSSSREARIDGPVGLVFLGRIVPEKGIEEAIECVRLLNQNGVSTHLDVIGRGNDDYVAVLKQNAADLPITWHGAIPHKQVPGLVGKDHFFIFPTRHFGEGHSNALTEAMSQGLVPLAADNGFNKTVIADTGVVLSTAATGADYADAVSDIFSTGRWWALSEAARQRIAEHYVGDKLVPELIKRYWALLT